MASDPTAKGRALLQSLLPWARAEARKAGDGELKTPSALGTASMSLITEAMLDALVIYPAPLGGWHADVHFRGVPPGYPNALGSPVAMPYATQREAEAGGKALLVMLCRIAAKNAREKVTPKNPAFLLYGVACELKPKIFELSLALLPEGAGGPNGGYVSIDHAIKRIEETLAEVLPGGDVTAERINALDRDSLMMLLSVLHISALTGLFAYPPRRDASPSGHREADSGRRPH